MLRVRRSCGRQREPEVARRRGPLGHEACATRAQSVPEHRLTGAIHVANAAARIDREQTEGQPVDHVPRERALRAGRLERSVDADRATDVRQHGVEQGSVGFVEGPSPARPHHGERDGPRGRGLDEPADEIIELKRDAQLVEEGRPLSNGNGNDRIGGPGATERPHRSADVSCQ